MTDYMYNLYKQYAYDDGTGRAIWETSKTLIKDSKRTDRNIEIATSKENMKFFKALGSKQKIQRTHNKEGKEVVKIFSYEPHNTAHRTVHEYIEI